MKKGLLVTLAILAIVLIGGCSIYKSYQNGLNKSWNEVEAKWADVQNQYQRRADLIDNLVATVKGAAAHEQNTLTAVIEARAKATQMNVNASDLTPEKMQEFQQAQGQLSQALGRLMVVSEAYPDLKVNQNFLALQDQIEGTENRITTSRKYYNDVVLVYNTKVTNFPTNIVAGAMGFQKRPTFSADKDAQKAPKVQF
ncbi:LemA family protein [Taibaiella lutea]|uniref:LemA family protein n=1 Tax=Taibaiella lutea TaxID=2608001 RepID=A0A5M6CQF0_9BACT|nr:LemA family protein [Taibaiella lutea]KAA5536202.1 LemA family protein [Taibaiella lutea]